MMTNPNIFYFDPFRDGDYTLHPKVGYTVRKILGAYYTSYYNSVSSMNLNGIPAVGITRNSNTSTNISVWTNSLSHAFANGALNDISGLGLINMPIDLRYAFNNCQHLTYIDNFPSQTTYLNGAFCNCISLTTIPTIPDSVKSMVYTFDGCTNLTGDIYIYSNQITNAANCFNNTSLTKQVHIPFRYTNGEYTSTYNALVAEYGSGQNGVVLMDLNSGAIV